MCFLLKLCLKRWVPCFIFHDESGLLTSSSLIFFPTVNSQIVVVANKGNASSRLSFLIIFSHINLPPFTLFFFFFGYSQKSSKDSPSGTAGVMLADGYLADLATADANRVSLIHKTAITTSSIMMTFLLLQSISIIYQIGESVASEALKYLAF